MFMQANMDQKLVPTEKRMIALMRRIAISEDGKITYNEFAKIIRPVDLGPYIKRIRKRTKQEDKYAEEHKHDLIKNELKDK